jgi:hypothetical protein
MWWRWVMFMARAKLTRYMPIAVRGGQTATMSSFKTRLQSIGERHDADVNITLDL